MGIDIGSASTDVVIIDDEKRIIAYTIEKSGYNQREAAERAIKKCLSLGNLAERDIVYTVGTGYGRRNIEVNCDITEISCHAMGMYEMNRDIRTLIDIGGEDTKIIKLRDDGYVEDFTMNDKCSAGTGRFLERMSQVLGISDYDMSKIAENSHHNITISSTCTVFAESEVISRVSAGEAVEDIVSGIHRSICKKVYGMLMGVGVCNGIAMSGGVSKNSNIVLEMSKLVGVDIYVPPEPQIIGAYGAAIFALNLERRERV